MKITMVTLFTERAQLPFTRGFGWPIAATWTTSRPHTQRRTQTIVHISPQYLVTIITGLVDTLLVVEKAITQNVAANVKRFINIHITGSSEALVTKNPGIGLTNGHQIGPVSFSTLR
jgi:hypothetical protein